MRPRDVLTLPVRMFWAMNDMVGRIRAEEDQHQFLAMNHAQGGEAAQAYAESLDKRVGKVYVFDVASMAMSAERDEDGISALKAMALQSKL